jgi:MFS family permease
MLTLVKNEIGTLLPIYMVVFLSFFGYALTIALFIPMLMDSHVALLPAASPTATRVTLSGLLLAMYPLGQFLGSPVIGHLSDHFGRKKILILSLILCIIGFSGIAISIYLHSLVWLFISCIFTGLCESNMAISQSIIADKARDNNHKTKLIGYAFSACSLGYVLGPLLGGAAAHQFGYSLPFVMTASFVIALIAWLAISFNDSYKPNTTIKINIWEAIFALKTLATHKHVRKIYLINFLIFFSVQGLYRVVPLYLVNTWRPSLLVYSHIIAYVSFLCLLANLFFISRLAKYFSTKSLLIGLLILGAICVFSIIIPKQFHWIWLTYGLAVIPTVMTLTTCTIWLSNQVDSKEQGQVLGNNQALLVLGEASSAAIGGAVAAINISLPIIMMGFILFACSFMIFSKK